MFGDGEMQKDMSTSHGRFNEYLTPSSPYFNVPDAYDFSSSYSSIFPPNPDPNPRLVSPQTTDSDDYTNLSKYWVTEHQEELMKRQKLCLSQLRETAREAETLRQENVNLQIANFELNKQFKNLLMLQSSSAQNYNYDYPVQQYNNMGKSAAFCYSSLVDNFQGMHIAEKAASWDDEASDVSIETEDGDNLDVNRVSLPKSISVRSNGYLKTVPQAVGTTSRGGGHTRAPNRIKPVKPAQRVYVHGVKKEEKPLELQVYNQGMSKTELCNKWQQTGACPYGDNCHFAHGIEELRPVIRHPRYKTEVCRMVLNGDCCPYGHRCHFRHALTDQEKLIAEKSKSRSLRLK